MRSSEINKYQYHKIPNLPIKHSPSVYLVHSYKTLNVCFPFEYKFVKAILKKFKSQYFLNKGRFRISFCVLQMSSYLALIPVKGLWRPGQLLDWLSFFLTHSRFFWRDTWSAQRFSFSLNTSFGDHATKIIHASPSGTVRFSVLQRPSLVCLRSTWRHIFNLNLSFLVQINSDEANVPVINQCLAIIKFLVSVSHTQFWPFVLLQIQHMIFYSWAFLSPTETKYPHR